MQNDKLLPCPFCGGEAETTFICDGRYNQIKCKTPKCIKRISRRAKARMKQPRKPTRQEKIFLSNKRLDAKNWMVLSETKETIVFIHKISKNTREFQKPI